MRTVIGCIGLTLLATSLPAAAVPAPVIDNERVTVWDVVLPKGISGPSTPHDMDTVIMFLEGGKIRTTAADGKSSTATRKFGDAVFVPKGKDVTDVLTSDGAAHEIVIALKDHPSVVIANTSGLPAAFPRPGSVKVLDNERFTVWHFSWTPGKPTHMHFHDKDIVVAFRYDGALKSVTPDGASVVNAYKAGDIRFNKGNRAHYEELTGDRQSAVMMELK
jgi:predicted metal-dependent enzyme (double-stranded beta helix superfamily)